MGGGVLIHSEMVSREAKEDAAGARSARRRASIMMIRVCSADERELRFKRREIHERREVRCVWVYSLHTECRVT